MATDRRDAFWKTTPGLVWSNSRADDSIMIRAALTRPRFHQLLSICLEFSVERVELEFETIRKEITSPVGLELVSQMLENIKEGFRRAEKGNRRSVALPATTA